MAEVGIGSSMVATPFVLVLAFYFKKRRNLFISLSAAVIGVGMLISAPVALAVLDSFGIHDSFIFLGGFNAQLIVIGMICHPSPVEINIKSARRKRILSNVHRNQKQTCLKSFNKAIFNNVYLKLLMNLPFLLFLLSTVTWNAMLAISLMHLPNYISKLGFGVARISAVMLCLSICNTIGRLLAAFLVDRARIDSVLLHSAMLILAGVVTIPFPYYGRFSSMEFVFAALVGLATGLPNSLMAPIVLNMVGMEKITAAHGLEYLFCGAGYTLGPVVAAALYASSGTYTNSFIAAGCIVLGGGGIGIIVKLLQPNTQKNAEATSSDIVCSNTSIMLTEKVTKINVDGDLDHSDTVAQKLLEPRNGKENI